MRKIKDFFYDKSDIIIVLIILAVAAFIIYTRIDNIMEYPEKLAKQAAATQETETTASATSEVTSITIEEADTITTVSEKLNEAGLTSSAEEFEKYVNDQNDKQKELSDDGSEHQVTLKIGTFQIPNGSTLEDILDIVSEI